MSDSYETPVIFRAGKDDGEVIAIFPADAYTRDGGHLMTCYAHVGQHGSCDEGWYRQSTRPASPSEYASLKGELEAEPYGYRFKIYQRITPQHREARRALADE